MEKGEYYKKYFFFLVFTITLIILYIAWKPTPTTPEKELADYTSSMFETFMVSAEKTPLNLTLCMYSHIVSGKNAEVEITNNHNQTIEWGNYWEAEKLVDNYWVKQNPPWDGWTLELHILEPGGMSHLSFLIDWLEPGIHRITKNIDVQNGEKGVPIIFYIEKTHFDVDTPKEDKPPRLNISQFDEPETVEEMLRDLQEVVGKRNIEFLRMEHMPGETVPDYHEFLELVNRTTRLYISYMNGTGYFRAEVEVGGQTYVWITFLEQVLIEEPPDEFSRNLGIILSFQDGIEPSIVKIKIPEHNATKWIQCHESGEWYNMSEKISFLLHSHHPTRISYPNYCTVSYVVNGENRTIERVVLDRNIISQTYSALYQELIKYIEIKIGVNESSSLLVWEGPFGNVPRECVKYYTGTGVVEPSSICYYENEVNSITFVNSSSYQYMLINDRNTPQAGEGCSFSSYLNIPSDQVLDSEKIYVSGPSYTFRNKWNGEFSRVIEPYGLWIDEMPSPLEQARMIITSRVSLDYFEKYFEYDNYQTHDGSAGSWNQHIGFNYNIEIGSYFGTLQVEFKFDSEDYLLCYYYYLDNGLPEADNLMPFYVTREQAVEIALANNEGIDPPEEVVSRIGYMKRNRADDVIGINEYTWVVYLYQDPRDSWSGDIIEYYIDLYTGRILRIDNISWSTS